VRLVDTRHEQTAAFAAEGWAKVTRRVGVAALTAGPGVTNGVSAITSAWMNGSPVFVIGGRAPVGRWGQGSLQELDHVPIVASVTKYAATASSPDAVVGEFDAALRAARSPHRGPTFVDVPLDAWGPSEAAVPGPVGAVDVAGDAPDPDAVAAVAAKLAAAIRPVLMLGGDVYWAGAELEALALAEGAGLPVFVNDMARGVIPADHSNAFSRARGAAFKDADVVAVIGTPLDFRLGFGRFGDAEVIHVTDTTAGIATHTAVAASASGDLARVLGALADQVPALTSDATRAARIDWIVRLRAEEDGARARDDRLASDAFPIDPVRIYGELRARLDRDAIVIGDGGDFVSYAGRYVDTYTPGCFIGPGPYGCLGSGMGYALAAATAFPDRQVVLLLGDGAIGFGLGDLDTLARHHSNVVGIVGNNSIWGLEKHPMQMLFGYDVACDLAPETRYDKVAEDLGCHGEVVRKAAEIGPALDRAFAHAGPSLINVMTDPADAYPRSSNLA